MNTFTTAQQRISEATAAEQRAHEPSMEEILASIRRIIADDQMLPISRPAAPAAPPADTPAAPAPVAFRASAPPALTVKVDEEMIAERAANPFAPRQTPIAGERVEEAPKVRAEPQLRESLPAAAPEAEPAREPPKHESPRSENAWREPPPAQAARPAIKTADLRREEANQLISPAAGSSVSSAFNALATTMILQNQGMVEEATREMLRPMLKQWLDDNLPVIVERLVRQEIERVARGGR